MKLPSMSRRFHEDGALRGKVSLKSLMKSKMMQAFFPPVFFSLIESMPVATETVHNTLYTVQ